MDAAKKPDMFLKRILSIFILTLAAVAAAVMAPAGEASAAAHLASFTPNCAMVIPRDIPQSQKAYFWNGSGYVQTAELRPGYGYFLATDFPASELTIPDCANDVAATGYTVALTKGWNLIGAPKSKTAAFPTLFNKLPAGYDKYIFDTAGLGLTAKTRSTVAAGGVYWLYVEAPSNITIPPVTSTPTGGGGEYILTPAVSMDKSDPSKVTVLLSAIMDSATGSPVMNLTKDNFKIYEGAEERVIDSVKPMAGNPSQTDIVFIMDITGSMGEEINGVRDSVKAFVDYLSGTGQDVRLGAVTFGDDVVDSFGLSTNTVYFKGFFSNLKRVDGADFTEYPLSAISYALENFSFRIEAQKIFILITDAAMHQKGDSIKGTEAHSAFTLTSEDILKLVKHRYVVHVVNKSYIDASTGNGENARVLSKGTGGAALNLDIYGNTDLSQLPIKGIISSGYIITYTTGSPAVGAARTAADVGTSRKLVTNIDGQNKGEVNF